MKNLEKGSPKLRNAWAFYDWANSVYSLVIMSAIFPIFFSAIYPKNRAGIEILGKIIKPSATISFVTAFAFLCVALLAPILSGIADYIGNKLRFLQFFCVLGALSCIGLYWFSETNITFGLTCYFFGLIGFWLSYAFYNSYLPDVAFKEQQDALSARGFSLGYIGSVLLLLACLFTILGKDGVEAMHAMRMSFVYTGVWWLVFSQYSFYYLPKGNHQNKKITSAVVFNGFKELLKVKNQLFQNIVLKRYLTAFFVYNMAVQTVMLVATYFGESEINWGTDASKRQGLIVSILLIQLVAVLGAYLTSTASAKFGNIPTLIFINIIWLAICVVAFFVTLPIHFYVTAGFVGLVMGGIQSLSRSTYSKFLPETEDTTSFFSFYDVTEKIGIVIGMSLYAIVDQVTGSMRNSILFLGLFFAVGLYLLTKVHRLQK